MTIGPVTGLRHAYKVARGLQRLCQSRRQGSDAGPSCQFTLHPWTLLLLHRPLNLLDDMPLLLLPTHSSPLTLLQLLQMRVLLRTRLRKPKLAHLTVPIRRLDHRVRDVPVLGDEVRDGAVRDEHDVGVGAREGEDVVAEGGGARGECGTRVGVFAGLLGMCG
jgi:hypothetical protein